MTDTPPIYRPKRLKFVLLGLGMLVLGLGATMPLWTGDVAVSAMSPLELLAGLACLGIGSVLQVAALLGFPRLVVTAEGVEYRSLLGRRGAPWHRLGPFQIATVSSTFRTARLAKADVIAAEGGKPVVIDDSFQTPLDTIVADLNARRLQALGPVAVADAPTPEADASPFGVVGFTRPWLSFAILAVLVLGFAAEHLFVVGPIEGLLKPHITTLLATGGLNGSLVSTHGDWYRLFTAPLLHGDAMHLAFNGIALLMVGQLLEPLVGRLWFAAIYVVGALGGALGSLLVNPPTLTSVGASGAIMGTFAAALAVSFRLPSGSSDRATVQGAALRVLIPSMLPLATTGTIDYAAHGGGALAGAAVGFALIPLWPAGARLPGWRGLAAVVAIVGALITVASVGLVARDYPRFQKLAGLIPHAELPRTDTEGRAGSAALVARYPDDPRAHFHRGMALIQARDLAAGERELRIAASQADALRFYLGGQLATAIHGILAAVQLDLGDAATAKETARPACMATGPDRPSEQIRGLLDRFKLCE